jgi:hypothetical protein
MSAMPKNISRWRPCVAAVALVVLLSASSAASAQSIPATPIAQRLSPDTVFCLEWHGKDSLLAAGGKNHVLQLLEDPSLAPVWFLMAMRAAQETQKPRFSASGLNLADLVSLLENPLAFGIAATPNPPLPVTQSQTPGRFGVFSVYDATGKRDLVEKFKTLSRSSSKRPVEITKYDFAGTSIEVRTSGKSVSYSAQVGDFFLGSDQKAILEDLVARFGAVAPTRSLARLPEYQQIREYIGTDASIEWFGRIPDLGLLGPHGTDGKTLAKLSRSLELEKVHVAGGGLSFAGEATRWKGAILGDTSAGVPFDLEGSSSPSFQLQSLVNGSFAFAVSNVDLAAAYAFMRSAVVGFLTPQQSANILILDGAAQSFMGMPIPAALALLRGEVASVTSYSDAGFPEQTYAAAIRDPDAVLRIVRALAGSMIAAEDRSGNTTFLDIAYPYTDPASGSKRKKSYYLAVTPQMLLGAPRKAMLRQTLTGLNSPTSAVARAGIFANPAYLQLRSGLPAKLSGLSATDLTQIPWDKVLARLQLQLTPSKPASQAPPDTHSIDPAVISRHLHVMVSGTWKDSGGVYFDSYIQ